jgi:carbamoyl-phosphate synthase large subunit
LKKLLFTGGGGAGNEALNRLWAGRYDMHFADADRAAISPTISRDHAHAIPFASDEGFASGLAAVCRNLSIDVLIPSVDEELPSMTEIMSQVDKTEILVPAAEYVATMLDKMDTAKALDDAGLDAPKTVLLDDASSLGFPCIAKPRQGRGSRGFAVLENADAAQAYGNLYGAKETVAQELLVGQEYTVVMVADRKGTLDAVVPVRVAIKRGITISAETDQNETVINACTAIHRALPTSGTYNIQLMLCDDGRVVPFEINPRISTTFCLAVAAGVDPVALYMGEGGSGDFKAGVTLSRHWNNVFTGMDEDS